MSVDSKLLYSLLTRKKLADAKLRAVRRGIWFAVLNRLERSCIDVTIKVVGRVRSSLLAKVLTPILLKLSSVMESKLARFMRESGFDLALNVSKIARAWGHKLASQWAGDVEFIRYLSVIRMNSPLP